jgi:delta 1-pyrroline-5-carboxylate dehydrogenase
MPSPFQAAVFAVIAAEREYETAFRQGAAWNPSAPPLLQAEIDSRAAVLARAGDALESELRRMMREEAIGQR